MKKRLLSLSALLLLASNLCFSQGYYSFSYFQDPYNEITGGTSLFPVGFYDTLYPGYNITIDGRTNDTIRMKIWGTLSADTTTSISERIFESFGAEHGQGNYSYVVENMPGSRILKIQYKNAKFYHDFTSSDYINFQTWLYEADNSIEVHYGPSNIQHHADDYYYNESGPYIGFIGFQLTGAVSAPTSVDSYARVTGTPPNGMVYRFEPASSTVKATPKASADLIVFPNPAGNIIFISNAKPSSITVYDITGRVQSGLKHTINGGIDISALPVGLYLLKADDRHCRFVKK